MGSHARFVEPVLGVAFRRHPVPRRARHACSSRRTKRAKAETDALEAKYKSLPVKIERHSLVARLFHWVMAAAMFVLLFTAFLPIVGIKFAWGTWHWMAGLVLTASIIFHIIHASFCLDFWSIWVGPKDIPEFKAEMMRELGHDVPGPKSGKYPLGNRLYHLAIVVAGIAVVATGVFMMVRVRTPFFTRNPYLFGDSTWGLTYVSHGLAGVGLVGLVIAHVYFAVRPEKWWITKSMIFRVHYAASALEHHEPTRWVVAGGAGAPSATPTKPSQRV
jgi:cytochrome b subunit of formate dehydrogenase